MIRSSTSTCYSAAIAALAGFQTQPGYLIFTVSEASGLVSKSRALTVVLEKRGFI